MGQVGGGDPRPRQSGARLAGHLRHRGGRRGCLRRRRAPVQGRQGQAQLPRARPGPHRPGRLPRLPWYPPAAAAASISSPIIAIATVVSGAVPGPDAVRATASQRQRRGQQHR